MCDLTLYIAYISIGICIFYFQETTTTPIYASGTFHGFIDGDYYIYSVKSNLAIDGEDENLKEAKRDGGSTYQLFTIEKDTTFTDWYKIYCDSDLVSVVKKTHWFSSDTFWIKKGVSANTDDQLFKFEITIDGYVIKSKSGYAWDANGDLKGRSTIPSSTYDESQMLRIIQREMIYTFDQSKPYFIYSVKSALAIDCAGSNDHVQQHTRHGRANQQFYIKPHSGRWEITCADSTDCWELTHWGNVIHTRCRDWDAQRFHFLQRSEGIAIIPERSFTSGFLTAKTYRTIVDIDSSGKGYQLIGKEKWVFDDNQLFRITEVPLTTESFAACTTASYVPSYGIRNNWMSYISPHDKINRISIPGTHDTMCANEMRCLPTCSFAQTQTLDLSAQLNAGIRALDIRLVTRPVPRGNSYFQVQHGGSKYWSYDTGHSFDEVLDIAQNFLHMHTSEFILMRIEREIKSQPEAEFLTIFKSYYNSPKYSTLFWPPGSFNPPIPKVSAVAGKVVILQGFKYDRTHYYGLNYKLSDFDKQDEYTFDGRDKYLAIANQFENSAATSSSSTKFYLNYFSSAGALAPPHPFGASCTANIRFIYGSNVKAYDYMLYHPMTFVGIIYMDFPGQVLIDEVIKTNPSLKSQLFTAKHVTSKRINDIVHDKVNDNGNTVGILLNKSGLILFASIALLIILNIYCVYLYFMKTKVKSNTYDLVTTRDQSDIEDLSI